MFGDGASALLLCLSPLCPTQFLRGGDPAPGGRGNLASAAIGAQSRKGLLDMGELSSETRAFSLKLLHHWNKVSHGWKLYSLADGRG